MYTGLKKISDNRVVGYKVAYKESSLYYSVSTNIPYITGNITEPVIGTATSVNNIFSLGFLQSSSSQYEPRLRHRTLIFKDLEFANYYKSRLEKLLNPDDNTELVMLEMKGKATSEYEMFEGKVDDGEVWAIPYITNIVEL